MRSFEVPLSRRLNLFKIIFEIIFRYSAVEPRILPVSGARHSRRRVATKGSHKIKSLCERRAIHDASFVLPVRFLLVEEPSKPIFAHPLTAKGSKLSKQIDDARSARSGGPARVGPSRARGMHHMHLSSSIEERFAVRACFSFGHTIYYKACK